MPASSVLSDLPPLSDPTARRVLVPAAATAGLLVLALVLWPRNRPGPDAGALQASRSGPSTATAAPSNRQMSSKAQGAATQSTSGVLQAKTAESVLRQWQVGLQTLHMSLCTSILPPLRIADQEITCCNHRQGIVPPR